MPGELDKMRLNDPQGQGPDNAPQAQSTSGYISRITCRLCESDQLEDVIHFPDTPVGDEYVREPRSQRTFPLNLAVCQRCGHLMIREVVDPELLYGNFSYLTRVSLGLTEHFRDYAYDVARKTELANDAFVLDIGSNDGTLLRFFMEQGMRVLGVDPAEEAVRIANQEGVESLPIYFNDTSARELKDKYGQADLIVSNNTFANIDDLTGFFEAVRIMMAPGGTFVFETGYAVDLARFIIFDNIYHEHLSYFLVAPLEQFFRRIGMHLYNVERIDTKGGSIRGYVRVAQGDPCITESVRSLLELENEYKSADLEVFKLVNDRIDSARQATHELLDGLKTEGKIIAGYGASVGVTTMIYHMGLAGYLEYVVDDNEIKHGLYSPGEHIPVYSSEEIYARNPDYIVILAWRYADPIVSRHQEFLERGGHFIVPIPAPQIV